MLTPLEVIASFGAPTDSYIQAIHHFRRKSTPMSRDQHIQGIADILGADAFLFSPDVNDKEVELQFLYVVQETIRAFNTGTIPEMDEVWKEAFRRKVEYIQITPWAIKTYEGEEDEDGNVVVKVDKKQMSEDLYLKMNDGEHTRTDIIDAFVEQVELSKPGATTYFHNLKKIHGFSGPSSVRTTKSGGTIKGSTVKGKKGPTKTEIAVAIVKELPDASKEDIIARIVEEANTTPAGANTYYCSAKKIVEA